MRRFFVISLALLALSLPARAEEGVVAGLSQNRVAITANFVGSEILIYGAVKRDEPAPREPLAVAIIVEGPPEPVLVRRKEKRFGIWLNTDAVEIASAPSFYAVATSVPFDEVFSEEEDAMRRISIGQAIESGETDEEFAEAITRIRSSDGLYSFQEEAVRLREDTLFDARIQLPAKVTEGFYRARVFLTREGEVVAHYTTRIEVRKVGLERWVYRLAHEKPLIYGLMSLVIAVAAGWAASAAFRKLFRT